MPKHATSVDYLRGFTLLEVMLVLLIMGLAASTLVYNFSGQDPQEQLRQQSQRFEVVFNMASDYAILNQQTLGLRVEDGKDKNSYHFLRLDEQQQWQLIEGDATFATHKVPSDYRLKLQLDDLPWDNSDSFFDNKVFDEELSVSSDGVQIGKEEEKRPEPPQVLILPSGDISSFSLLFSYIPEFGSVEPVYYRVNGQDAAPLSREGPLDAP